VQYETLRQGELKRRNPMRIVLATDGSEGAVAAARLVAELPLDLEDTVTLLSVLPDPTDAKPTQERAAERAEQAMAPAREALCHCAASLVMTTCHGHPAREIVHFVEEHPTDLAVMGSRGLSAVARFVLGSVTERVARHAPSSILVARPRSQRLRRVLIGVDDSDAAAHAVAWLGRLPLPPEVEIRLVTVLPLLDAWSETPLPIGPPLVEYPTTLAAHERERAQARLHALSAPLAAAGRAVVTELRTGDPALALLRVADEEGTDLLVAGSQGRSAISRFLLGSVSEKLLRYAHCSVLIVKQAPGATRENRGNE
jgi:nucleotide-binding universal stress UspA family protein